jgi:hypothetical protein
VMVCSDRHKLMGLVVGWPGYNRIMRALLSENNEGITDRKKDKCQTMYTPPL